MPPSPRHPETLLTVAKQPAPGATKTRLSPPLSAAQSAGLYECFLRDTLDLIRRTPGVGRGLAYLPVEARAYFHRLAPDFELVAQQGGSLGERLHNLFRFHFGCGSRRVVIVDSDSPTLPVEYLAAAFSALESHDVVLGPCEDGGYYLIGLQRPAPRLLLEVEMSTPRVLADTLRLADEEGLGVNLLPAWYDVDDLAGLERLQSELMGAPPGTAPATRRYLQSLGIPPG